MLRSDLTGIHFELVTEEGQPFTKVEVAEKDKLPPGYKVKLINPHSCQSTKLFQWKENSTLELVMFGPCLLGDILTVLQQTLNFTYSMVRFLYCSSILFPNILPKDKVSGWILWSEVRRRRLQWNGLLNSNSDHLQSIFSSDWNGLQR